MSRYRNTFSGGMVRDRADAFAPDNTYYTALNATTEREDDVEVGLTTEQGTRFSVDVGGEILGTTYIEQIKKSLVFVRKNGSSIFLFDHVEETLELVLSDSEFGCDWGFDNCEFMYAEVKEHNACDDIYIYFSSDCKYYVVNTTEMLDPVRKQAILDSEDCSYFELVQPICTPVINTTPVVFAGTTLESGAVAFSVRLTDNDGNHTNWFAISGTTTLRSENNVPGEPSINAIEVYISGLDSRYEYVEVAAIKTGAGVTTVERLPKMAYSGNKYGFIYYGQRGVPMDIAEITTKTKAYLQGKDLIQHDGRMFFYNLKREKNLNYQKYANEIYPRAVVYKVPLNEQLKYRFPSLQRGEGYAPAIAWNYADGTSSKAFAILGEGPPIPSGNKFSAQATRESEEEYTWDTEDRYTKSRGGVDENPAQMDSAIQDEITGISTDIEDAEGGASGLDNCCDGQQGAVNSIREDLNNAVGMVKGVFETMAEFARGKNSEDVELNRTSSLKDAALDLYDAAVNKRVRVNEKTPTLTIQRADPSTPSSLSILDDTKRFDNWIDNDGGNTTDFTPQRDSVEYEMKSLYSTLDYPDFLDCEGNRMFPEGKIRYYQVPLAEEIPTHEGGRSGAFSNLEPTASPYDDVIVNLVGLKLENIVFPSEDELPKPLCPIKPYTILYVKRDVSNSTVVANGWVGGTCIGENRGKKYYFQRHGVNSRDNVFRGVDAPYEGESDVPNDDYFYNQTDRADVIRSGNRSRFARPELTSVYTFHSPDTDFNQGRLTATKLRSNYSLFGQGWRYGLYAKGEEPADNWTGQRVDQRGARISNSILGRGELRGDNPTMFDIEGIINSKHGTVSQPVGGIEYPVDSVYNESSVVVKTSEILPELSLDRSFSGDVLDHEAPTSARSVYVSLIREIPDQYGGIENRAYIQLGIYGRKGWTSTEGICGDVFVGPYTKRRTSFVSEKVGDEFQLGFRNGEPTTERSVCDPSDDRIFEYLGLNVNQNELPISGDVTDPKNHAGLYSVQGQSYRYGQTNLSPRPTSDFYYPGTVTGVVHSIVESRVVSWERSTGDPALDRIYAEELKGYALDSAKGEKRTWEECYLNNVNYVPVPQPSRKQLAMIGLVRNIIMVLIPASAISGITNIDGVFDAIATMFATSGLAALFMTLNHGIFRLGNIRRLFGLESCHTDSTSNVLNFKSDRHKDNWNRYNYDFSKITTETQYLGINSLYNTCDCSDCDTDDINQRGGGTSKEIYYSAKQNLDSEIDAYRNIKIGTYNELPAHAGNIRKIFLQNNNMYVHSTKGIWMVQMAAGNWPADIGSQLTGTGDLLMRPTLLLDSGVTEGFAGTNHPNASINVPGWGYFFVDDVARKVYRFNGKPEEISAYGMRKFFNKHLPFCDPRGCHDEVVGPKYVMGWDYKYNRLLLTKKERSEKKSFTISYSPSGTNSKWVSFHSYIPTFYLWDRYNLFSVDRNYIFKHNIPGVYHEYYGTNYPHMIQFTLVNKNTGFHHFELKNVKLFSDARNGGRRMLNSTFNEAVFWNHKDSTGNLSLKINTDRNSLNRSQLAIGQENLDEVEVYRNYDLFNINNIYSRYNLDCGEFVYNTEDSDCVVIENIDHSTSCLSPEQDYQRRNFGGRYVNVRLTYNNDSDTSLTTHFIEWEDLENGK